MMSTRFKAILINAALLTGCVIQLVRGYHWIVVAIAGGTLAIVANTIVLLKARADRKRRNPNYVGRFAFTEPGTKLSRAEKMRQIVTPREREQHRMEGPR